MTDVRVRSVRLPSYRKRFDRLPPDMQERVDAAYTNYFRDDPHHPSLQPSTYRHRDDERRVHKVCLPRHYRALAFVEDTENRQVYAWFWVGSHEDYNRVKVRDLVSSGAS